MSKRKSGPAKKRMGETASELEGDFRIAWLTMAQQEGAPAFEAQYRFHPERAWAFDFAWPAQRVAVEIDGGQWQAHGGRHARDTDKEKLNQAAVRGWRVLHYSGTMLNNPERVVAEVRRALEGTYV